MHCIQLISHDFPFGSQNMSNKSFHDHPLIPKKDNSFKPSQCNRLTLWVCVCLFTIIKLSHQLQMSFSMGFQYFRVPLNRLHAPESWLPDSPLVIQFTQNVPYKEKDFEIFRHSVSVMEHSGNYEIRSYLFISIKMVMKPVKWKLDRKTEREINSPLCRNIHLCLQFYNL